MKSRIRRAPRALALPAYAKINLGLQVLGKRKDGYHELRTVYQTISLHDTLVFQASQKGFELEVEQATKSLASQDSTHRIGLTPSGSGNLVTKAADAFARATRIDPAVRIRLHKRIPAGAGLGGGSSDAAVALLGLNRMCGGPLAPAQLHAIASGLGSDVPFFLSGGTALGLGRGEIVRSLRDLDPSWVVVGLPRFRVATVEAFRKIRGALTPARGQISIYRFCRQGVRTVRTFPPAPNDLERAVAAEHKVLVRLIGRLRAAGAVAAAMTGSGSAAYGLYAGEKGAIRALEDLTGASPVAFAWLGRTVGSAEYFARVIGAGAARQPLLGRGVSDGYHAGQDLSRR